MASNPHPAAAPTLPNPALGVGSILDDLVAVVRRFIVLGELEADAVARWLAHTYVYETAPATPYLNAYLRHTAITNDAAAGSSPIAVMTKAGHANMSTTKRYLHLAGTVFRDEATALEQRLLSGDTATLYPTLYPSEVTSEDSGEREPTSHQASSLT